MSKEMVAQALRTLADQVENGAVIGFTYEWNGVTFKVYRTLDPPIPATFINVTFKLEGIEDEPQVETDKLRTREG